ncbi:hypothetical protein AKUA1404_15360 [Apilactobacillus kunkeei]|uniref:Surface layer protein A domain-containing protein n=1 Tax=Apilactobacillus nanyangensis TaxID=2799579 RepID=A0ABT0HVS3_9LACO|nr:hypothetical protein [Apilactobacillus nanyangensis]MCK8611027.1 hypothetical protein [Apilactobacillus nanyangensis]TMS99867.1 hypothetical protein FD687_06640 [Apilactobacillus kunkeei]TMT03217.1 hypothetical protein FD689_06735 [Apilactobacillus kunkeei]CAI2699557.1 hypothetical protein AKUA1404_15360 [Apilactobacillus kunkeei]
MKKKVAAAFAAVGAVFLIGTTVHASANQTYTNRSEFVNVYKYGKLRHGRHTMMRYRYFKRIGHLHVGNRVRFNGSNFLFLPKLGGYVPEYQLKLVKPVKKVKKVKKVVVKPKKTTKKKKEKETKKEIKHVKKAVITETSASDLSLSNRMFDDSAVAEYQKPVIKNASKHIHFKHHEDKTQKDAKDVKTDGSNADLNVNTSSSDKSSSVSSDATTTTSAAISTASEEK